jgi:hypothetical protein
MGSAFARHLVAVLVFVAAYAYFGSFADYGFNREDEGTLLVQFWRWSTGEVPYRDFHYGYTPGVHFLHKTLMQWFGPDVMPGRWLLAGVNAGACTALFLLSAMLAGSWKWGLLGPLLYMATIPVHPGDFAAFNIPYPVWYCVFLFGVSAVMLISLREKPTLAKLLVAGALAGLNFTFKPNVGLFHLAAVAFVCLAAHGRPVGWRDRILWWGWMAALLLGLLFVFSSAPSRNEIYAFLGPITACAVAIARDAYRAPPRRDVPSLLASALWLGCGFLAVGSAWLIWAYGILGPEWFLRRALFLGAGFEQIYYLGGPSVRLDALALLASAAVWFAPSFIWQRLGIKPWPLLVAGVAGIVTLFAIFVVISPMPSGFYPSLMGKLEPKAFAAAAFVQWLAIFAWLARRRPIGAAAASDRFGPVILCGVLLYLQIFPRTDFMHWVTAVPLVFPLMVWGMQAITLRWSVGASTAGRRIVGAAVALPVLALAFVRLGHFVDARWDLRGGVPVRTAETRLDVDHARLSINAGQAQRYRDLGNVVKFIGSATAPDDTVFTFPALDLVSYLQLRKPGNRHGYYFPGWPGHDAEVEVLTALEKNPPKFAIALREHQLFFADAPIYYFFFAKFFETRYRHLASFGPYAVLVRNDVAVDAVNLSKDASSAVADALGAARSEELRWRMTSSDPHDRIAAAKEMEALDIASDFEPLRSALLDSDARVRSAAIRAADRVKCSASIRAALLHGAFWGLLDSRDSVQALRIASQSCDGSCMSAAIPLMNSQDAAIAGAARNLLASLAARRWRSSFWWKADPDEDAVSLDPYVMQVLRNALNEPEADPLLRELAFSHADTLGLDRCPRKFRQWALMRPQWIGGGDRTVVLALLHLARQQCRGNRIESALRWMTADSMIAPRVVLFEAARDPAAADLPVSRWAEAGFGAVSANAMWICSVHGGTNCLRAAQNILRSGRVEAERVAAAWAWSQLAETPEELAELEVLAAADESPQVLETVRYGIERRNNRDAKPASR